MTSKAAGYLLCVLLAGCGGTAPFGEDATDPDTTTDGITTDENGDPILREGIPPGTASPSPSTRIFRSEPRSTEGETSGNGFAAGISYDGDTDTFTVDGLAFDGSNTYQRGDLVKSFGSYAVYEADTQYPDSVNGEPINQFRHRAIYGVSRNRNTSGVPNTQFAIVRTGAYVNYGFGGFIYQRENGVTLPESGQARFEGQAAGMRDFNGRGGLEYSTADLAIDIDFEDFDSVTGGRGDAVRGALTNRRVFDLAGNDITAQVYGRINAQNTASLTRIPNATFTISPGVLDDNGEIVGQMTSTYVDDSGAVQQYETGNYYAIVSGNGPNEIVGVMVLENSAEFDVATVRDTSGFIVYRDVPAVQ